MFIFDRDSIKSHNNFFFLKESKIIKIKIKAQFSGHHWARWRRKERVKAFPDAQLFGLAAA